MTELFKKLIELRTRTETPKNDKLQKIIFPISSLVAFFRLQDVISFSLYIFIMFRMLFILFSQCLEKTSIAR